MNIAALTGRIGQVPEVFTFDNGNKKVSFSLAVDDGFYSKKEEKWVDQTIWMNIVAFKETKLTKGDLIEVQGKISIRNYDDKDGNKKYITEIVANTMRLLNRKQGENQTTGAEQKPASQPEQSRPTPSKPAQPDDDLPF